MSRKYDAETECIVWTAEELVPGINPVWSPMIGECIYNLRCALDHLWWQFAIDYLEREPREDEARDIQFPILTKTDPAQYESHRFLRYVDEEVAEKAKPLQGYDRGENEEPFLEVLAELSNHDKHRGLRPVLLRTSGFSTPMGDVSSIDCHIPKGEGEAEWAVEISWLETNELQVGDEVFWQKVVPTGPNPDIQVDPEIRCTIGLGPKRIALDTLRELGQFVYGVIVEFAPLLKSKTPD
jgi:hypothetical protein